MQIRVEIDDRCEEPEIVIRAGRMTEEISDLVQRFSNSQRKLIAGFAGDGVHLLDAAEVIRFYSEAQKIYAQTAEGIFTVRMRLYELEDRLDQAQFVRISNSEIVNLKAVRKIDLSLAGTVCIVLSNGTNTFVSRRYVDRIKKVLGI